MGRPNQEAELAQRMRSIRSAAAWMCPPDTARELRWGMPEHKLNYTRVRMDGVDALEVGRLAACFPDCQFFIREMPDSVTVGSFRAAMDVYIPARPAPVVQALKISSHVLGLVAAAAFGLALWTRAQTFD